MLRIACAYTRLVPIGELKPYSRNRNKHPKNQIKRLAELIAHHGLRHPVIVSNLSGEVVAGNGRLEALRLLGAEEIPVDYQDFEDSDAEWKFSISDNAIAEWAELDLEQINADLVEVGPFDLNMLGIKDFGEDPPMKKPMEVECPNCHEIFEAKRHRVKEREDA